MIETIATRVEFEAAFEKEFKASADTVGEVFLKYLDDTKENPMVRFRNTCGNRWLLQSQVNGTQPRQAQL